ncbi:helix-turn-helix transcriptional regulator [soil metagenome]
MYEAFGAYVRSQRQLARLTLRQAAELARISNPYLSQIEHGLALPSVTVLRALADALEVSTDTLLLRAAGVSTDEDAQTSVTEDAIRHDPRLDDAQRQALLAVLAAFVAASPVSADGPPASSTKPSSTKPSSTRPSPSTDREVTDHA